MRRMPVLGGVDELDRLHGIARTAALQTGAKGLELEEVTAEILFALIAQSNRAIGADQRRPNLQLVDQTGSSPTNGEAE